MRVAQRAKCGDETSMPDRPPASPSERFDPTAPEMTPRDAATLIVIDTTSSDEPLILMGRRRPDLVFMPNKYVFPGGRSEQADCFEQPGNDLPQAQVNRLLINMRGNPSPERARGLAMAAIRETYEETGVLVGTITDTPPSPPHPSQAGDASGQNPWAQFRGEGVIPSLANLCYFARAITPPGRPRRFDTRFFFVEASAVAKTVPPPDQELHDIGWHRLGAMRDLDLPNITRNVIKDIENALEQGLEASRTAPVPFYYFKDGNRERDLLSI